MITINYIEIVSINQWSNDSKEKKNDKKINMEKSQKISVLYNTG